MSKNLYKLLFIVIIFIGSKTGYAQQLPSAKTGQDSIYFDKPYPYILPILGSKAHNANIRMPFPIGIMFNTLTGRQNLGINNMLLGFGNSNDPTPPEMIDLGDFVTFEDITAQTATFNMRIDAWILPFLNLYSIVGQTKKADINVNLINPIPLNVTTEVSGTYVGFGVMAAGAVGPLFVSLDANRTYNYNPRLEDPAKVLIAGLRTGPVFRFNKYPEMNISVWTGAMYSRFNSNTLGSIQTVELAPDAPAKIDEMTDDLNSWYDDLSPADKIRYYLPYTKLNDGLANLKGSISNGYIRYSFNKTIEKPWNMLIGAQWQINYRWQIRAEAQFLGDRTAGLFSLNYRFGIRGKNWFSKNN